MKGTIGVKRKSIEKKILNQVKFKTKLQSINSSKFSNAK